MNDNQVNAISESILEKIRKRSEKSVEEMTAQTAVPAHNGVTMSKENYPELYDVIGRWKDEMTFKLPDFNGQFVYPEEATTQMNLNGTPINVNMTNPIVVTTTATTGTIPVTFDYSGSTVRAETSYTTKVVDESIEERLASLEAAVQKLMEMGRVEWPQATDHTTYNPTSEQDDYYFANSSLGRDKITWMQEDFISPKDGEGRGSKVETLPTGDECEDFDYFRQQLHRAFRIPNKYLEIEEPNKDDSTKFITRIGRTDYEYAMELMKKDG